MLDGTACPSSVVGFFSAAVLASRSAAETIESCARSRGRWTHRPTAAGARSSATRPIGGTEKAPAPAMPPAQHAHHIVMRRAILPDASRCSSEWKNSKMCSTENKVDYTRYSSCTQQDQRVLSSNLGGFFNQKRLFIVCSCRLFVLPATKFVLGLL